MEPITGDGYSPNVTRNKRSEWIAQSEGIAMYELHLSEDDMYAICFSGGRYEWSRALLFYLKEGHNEISEPLAWDLSEAFGADTEGGHSPFPLLAPDCKLYTKLSEFWDSIV
mgnify:CR=1 FL=1